MTIDQISLQQKLLGAPDFSEYRGGDVFSFQEKTYQKYGNVLGSGCYGEVHCFKADDYTKLAVKSELIFNSQYSFGDDFQKEADCYQKIYGLGIFSGNAQNHAAPHYVLMPYFSGKTLYAFSYRFIKDIFSCWIKTADAVKQLHEIHSIIHCDLKSDNIIFGQRMDKRQIGLNSSSAFIIDFGFATKIHEDRHFYVMDTAENRTRCTQHPPEMFVRIQQKKKAYPTQDIYALGMLLSNMYELFSFSVYFSQPSINALNTINEIIKNLTKKNPLTRWSIAKSIFMVITTFFSQIPREIWQKSITESYLYQIESEQFLPTVWRATASVVLQARAHELNAEQKALKIKSKRKEQKINGLKLLQSEIKIKNPEMLGTIMADAKIKFPDLTAGIFSHRTATLLDELCELAPVLH